MTFAFIFESVGGTEWIVLLGVILVVVGPKNLPAAMRKFGQITAQLRRAADEFKRQILAMDEEVRRTVDDAMKTDSPETSAGAASDAAAGTTDDAASPDASASAAMDSADGSDRAAEATDSYGDGYDDGTNPYPGHEFYDETTYQSADDGTAGDASANPQPANASVSVAAASEAEPTKPKAEPPKPKSDPYAIKITVSTAGGKKGAKA